MVRVPNESDSPDTPPATRRLLCLSGGGFRGLFSAIVLEHMEARLKLAGLGALRNHFDLIAGTSIGGLLACGLAAGVPARHLRETLEEHGAAVFTPQAFGKLRQALHSSLYSADVLSRVIERTLGPSAKSTLQDIDKALVVPAVSWITGEAVLYESAGMAGSQAAAVPLLDVCLATSAAPTYFPPHAIEQAPRADVLVDGGLVANAPDLVALTAAARRFALPISNFEMVSVGTAGSPAGGMAGTVPQSGVGWLRSVHIVKLVLAAQERLAVSQCRTLLGSNYLRVDQPPGVQHEELQALDRTDASTRNSLKKLAEQAIDDAKRVAPAWAAALL